MVFWQTKKAGAGYHNSNVGDSLFGCDASKCSFEGMHKLGTSTTSGRTRLWFLKQFLGGVRGLGFMDRVRAGAGLGFLRQAFSGEISSPT